MEKQDVNKTCNEVIEDAKTDSYFLFHMLYVMIILVTFQVCLSVIIISCCMRKTFLIQYYKC